MLTPQWVAKHSKELPSVFVSFFEITSDSSTASQQDSQLRNEIVAIRNAIARSGYKTRFAVVLLSDKTVVAAPELEDRLNVLRRAIGLDPKNAFFYLPPSNSRPELAAFVTSVLSALQPVCVEYYRDLSKHARRKKNRGYVPAPTGSSARGTSQSLTAQGWNVRYEFKQGVFAEFRQEMDAAERHYSFTIEELFSSEGVLENTPSWSARWEEARLLTDVTALRVLRCQLWTGMTSGAAESWVNYKERMTDLIDRRGKGTGTYGWAVWDTRWAEIMAQLLVPADLAIFQIKEDKQASHEDDNADLIINTRTHTYAPAEKAYPATDRIPPFHLMHHPGYWYKLASRRARSRRRRAKTIPEEDQRPPEGTPPSEMADRIRRYDTYLAPHPHQELASTDQGVTHHVDRIYGLEERAADQFGRRHQTRAQAQARLDQASLLAEEDRHQQVIEVLQPLWQDMPWRKEKWYELASRVISILHHSAVMRKDNALLIEVEWERMSSLLDLDRSQKSSIDMEANTTSDKDKEITMDSQRRISPISVTFAFAVGESSVGDSVPCQITLTNNTVVGEQALGLSALSLELNGNPHSLTFTHDSSASVDLAQHLALTEKTTNTKGMAKTLSSSANLHLEPQQKRLLNFAIPLRDAGTYSATDARIELSLSGYKVEYVFSQSQDLEAKRWFFDTDRGLLKKRIRRDESFSINVLPKPPKVMLRIANLLEQYFTNEQVVLDIDVLNEEVEPVVGSLDIEVLDSLPASLNLRWEDGKGDQALDSSSNTETATRDIGPIGRSVDQLHRLCFNAPSRPMECSFRIGVTYTLESDPETPVTKTLTLSMIFVSPFEANFDLLPRLESSAWPNFFSLPATPSESTPEKQREGIAQQWQLLGHVASFADETLIVESASLVLNSISSNAICDFHTVEASHYPRPMETKSQHNLPFVFTTHRTSYEDRRPSNIDLSLAISWRRTSSSADSEPVTTTLLVPKLTIPGPEPRVLCTASPSLDSTSGTVNVTYTLENPSMHFLTFTITMDATDQFAFSGPKFRTVSLTPLSRMTVDYRLLPHSDKGDVVNDRRRGRGRWISPSLRVVDSYFQKTLRVMEGGDGVKSDRKTGVVGIWIPEQDI